MNALAPTRCLLAAALAYAAAPSHAAPAAATGEHDFDFEIGTWKTHVKRLVEPLSGSDTWVELEGTSIVRSLLDGRANLVELDVAGPSGRIQGVSLRLYRSGTRDWSLNFASLRNGLLTAPVIGAFKDGRGQFYGRETIGERAVDVRFVIECPARDTCRFEQAFSADGRKTWETNWIATDTRVADARS